MSPRPDLATRILTDHREMDELLLLHQEALIEQDLGTALARFEAFHARLRAHIELENRELLPRHEQVAQPRWRTQVYALEHDKILELAGKLHERLRQAVMAQDADAPAATGALTGAGPGAGIEAGAGARSDGPPGQARRRWIIQLLDDERTLKNVLEHHEEREEKGALPELGLAPFPEG